MEAIEKRKVCSKLTIKTPEQLRSGGIIVNVNHISHIFLVFFYDFEQVNICRMISKAHAKDDMNHQHLSITHEIYKSLDDGMEV